MDIEMLRFRADVLRRVRAFFYERGYLETDTPALSPTLIPETCLEVFRTDYAEPWSGKLRPLYLVPSPEIYMKKIISQHRVSVFQISKCYRNAESVGRIHSPEFTMLEYYTVGADYRVSAELTEQLFAVLLPPAREDTDDPYADLRPPFLRLTMDDAFARFAGFRLSDKQTSPLLAAEARRMGLSANDGDPWDDLYELILVHAVEPALPREHPVLLTDYPARVPCLAQDLQSAEAGSPPLWKERWELYARGIELANCYTEERNPGEVREYFRREAEAKNATARIPHAVDPDYWRVFEDFPPCSGAAMGLDRLIMLLAGQKTIEPVIPFADGITG